MLASELTRFRPKNSNYLKTLREITDCGRLRLAKSRARRHDRRHGEVAEWLKAHAWKVCIRETVSRVRIPLSPPLYKTVLRDAKALRLSYRGQTSLQSENVAACPCSRPLLSINCQTMACSIQKRLPDFAIRTPL